MGLVSFSAANGVNAAHSTNVARRLTEAVDASLIVRAVAVCSTTDDALLFQANSFHTTIIILATFGSNLSAFHIGIATEATRAVADGDVI